jgi:hypothetical protein
MKSFLSKLWSTVETMWKKAPQAEVALSSAVNYAVPFVEEIDDLATPELAPVIDPILDKVKVGLSALATTIKGVGPAANVTSISTSIVSNLSALESAVQIKDPATATKINGLATLINAEVQAVESQYAAIQAAAAAQAATKAPAAEEAPAA